MATPGQSLPMYFPPAPFSLNDAVICSALVNAAYDMYAQWVAQGWPAEPSRFRWVTPAGPIVPGGPALNYLGPMWGVARMLDHRCPEPFGFIAWDSSGTTYLAFRGSETVADFWEDAAMEQVSYDPILPGFGLVHDGFNEVYTGSCPAVAALRSTLLSELAHLSYTPTALYVSGHSLGAGLSTLCVPDVVRNSPIGKLGIPMFHYSLASPRVGDPAFASSYNFEIPVTTFRVANTEDLVPDGPPAVSEWYYEHVGTPIPFTAQYDSIGGNHDHQHCYFYALTHPDQPQGPVAARQSAERATSARGRIAAARGRCEQLKARP
jgi:triacylglycerol lipase